METLKIQCIPDKMGRLAPVPQYATPGSCAMDLRAFLLEPMTLQPMERAAIPTGIAIQLPALHAGLVLARSGLATRQGLTLANGVGLIDTDYRGEILCSVVNLSSSPITVRDGDRIAQLNRELKEVKRHREVTRTKREKQSVPVAAIVGYTNAGKSTLLNTLTDAGGLEEDQLFATLDPTTRSLTLPGRQEILLTDTVGFIRKLPHHLIEAFKSTLEEAKYADIILHVVDASNPQMDVHMHVVYETLRELGVKDKKIITLFNKQDARTENGILRDFKADRTLPISARTGQGLDELKELLGELLRENKVYVERILSYANAGLVNLIRGKGELLSEAYEEDGIHVKAYVPMEIYHLL